MLFAILKLTERAMSRIDILGNAEMNIPEKINNAKVGETELTLMNSVKKGEVFIKIIDRSKRLVKRSSVSAGE